jgi:hypothetical protein
MALRKFLYIDPTYGYHDEQDAADSLSMGDLTLDGSGAGTGTLQLTGGGTIRGLPTTPSNSDEATSKAYVDSLTSGVTWRPPVITMEMISDLLSAPPGSPADGDSYVTTGQSGGPFAITAVNTGAKTFTVTGDHSSLGAGDIIEVEGSTGNDGYYTVVSATYTTSTDIVVSEVVPDGTADGTVDYCDPGTAWDTIGTNKIVCYNGTSWDELDGTATAGIQDGDRVVVKESGNGGSFTDASAIYQYNGSSWVVNVPADGWAVLVQDYSHTGYWDNTGWTYELSNDDWVQFTGAGQITAGAGLTKSGNTIDVGNGDGIKVNADSIEVELSATPGLELTGVSPNATLQVKTSGSEGVVVNANGVALEIDDTPDTLDVDADGLKVVGLPSLFKINDVAVGATVTAANLDTLTDGSSGVTLHTHTPPSGVEYADRVEDTHENQAAVTTGFAVRWGSVNNQIQHADNATAVGARSIGVARVGGAISPGTSDIVKHGVCAGCLTPHADSFSVNDEAFLGASGALRLYTNVPKPGRVIRMGYCKNAADLDVQIMDLGRARA